MLARILFDFVVYADEQRYRKLVVRGVAAD